MKAPSYQPATTFTWTPSGSVASATSTSFAASASATLRTSPRRNASPTSPAVPSATARRSCGPRSRGLAKLVATSGDRTGARARARAPASGDLALAGDRRDGADPLGRDLLVLGALDVPDEAELLQRPDDRVGRVGLEAAQAVAGGGRERVVAVVPALAERDHRDEPVVAALVLDRERPAAVHVADGVDAPGRVVEQEHAYEAGPDEGGEAGEQRAAREREAEHERDRQAEVRWPSNSQPMWECQRPVSTPRTPSASCVCGECGSPSSSVKAWWRRWSATQWITAPCTDIEPRIAKVARRHGFVSKARWVSMRWKPIVTPKPTRTYITARIARSSQVTPEPHRRAMAVTKPRKGTTTAKTVMRRSRAEAPVCVSAMPWRLGRRRVPSTASAHEFDLRF